MKSCRLNFKLINQWLIIDEQLSYEHEDINTFSLKKLNTLFDHTKKTYGKKIILFNFFYVFVSKYLYTLCRTVSAKFIELEDWEIVNVKSTRGSAV